MLKARWLWYSIVCIICWGGWALLSRLGSAEIPPGEMQFLFTIGCLPVAFLLLASSNFRLERNSKGIFFGIANGVLSAAGGMAVFAAYRTGGDTSVITCATSLYPLITVALAALVLHERLRGVQIAGLIFATAAIIIFSIGGL